MQVATAQPTAALCPRAILYSMLTGPANTRCRNCQCSTLCVRCKEDSSARHAVAGGGLAVCGWCGIVAQRWSAALAKTSVRRIGTLILVRRPSQSPVPSAPVRIRSSTASHRSAALCASHVLADQRCASKPARASPSVLFLLLLLAPPPPSSRTSAIATGPSLQTRSVRGKARGPHHTLRRSARIATLIQLNPPPSSHTSDRPTCLLRPHARRSSLHCASLPGRRPWDYRILLA